MSLYRRFSITMDTVLHAIVHGRFFYSENPGRPGRTFLIRAPFFAKDFKCGVNGRIEIRDVCDVIENNGIWDAF